MSQLNQIDIDVFLSIHPSGGARQFITSICDSTLNEDSSVSWQNNLQNQVSTSHCITGPQRDTMLLLFAVCLIHSIKQMQGSIIKIETYYIVW